MIRDTDPYRPTGRSPVVRFRGGHSDAVQKQSTRRHPKTMNSETPSLNDAVHAPDTVRELLAQYQDKLGIPADTAELAKQLVIERYDKGELPGRGYEYAVAAALSIAADTDDIPRTLQDYVDAAAEIKHGTVPDYDPKETGITKNELRKEKRDIMQLTGHAVLAPDASVFLERYVDELDITDQETRDTAVRALDVLNNVRPNSAPSKKAAVAIEIAARPTGHPKQSEIAAVADISTVTLRKRRDEIRDQINVKQ